MAISLVKTLQSVEYTLYIISSIRLTQSEPESVEVTQSIYQSVGHYTDGFTSMIAKSVMITDENAVVAIKALLGSNYTSAVSAAEQFLVGAVAYYADGTIVA
jgi:hypothetical protein